MAFQNNFEIEYGVNCKYISLIDTTGLFNAVNNPEGYDSGDQNSGGNPSLTDITQAILRIQNSQGYSIDYDVMDGLIPFPNISSQVKIIQATDLPGLDRFDDGEWTFTYILVGNIGAGQSETTEGVLGIKIKKSYQVCGVECCVKKLFADVNWNCDPCKDPKYKLWNEADIKLKALKYAIECGNYKIADTLLKELKQICLNKTIKGCC